MVKFMTQKQKEIIADNLRAYENNFGYIKIVKEDYGKGFLKIPDGTSKGPVLFAFSAAIRAQPESGKV